ncbi:MAG: hypothetical protein RIB98_08350 [Acidimicrobiales bacterium]
MRWIDFRGIIVVAVALGAIAFAWNRIENHSGRDDAAGSASTTSTTTTTVPPTTTLSQEAANELICERARTLADNVAEIPDLAGTGPVAVLAYAFWEDIYPLTSVGARAEIDGVINYYADYLETAGPYDYDFARIIVEGDKEKLEQLVTRPAPGFEGARALIGFGCGVGMPEQPLMDAEDFADLEDRLLDDA